MKVEHKSGKQNCNVDALSRAQILYTTVISLFLCFPFPQK